MLFYYTSYTQRPRGGSGGGPSLTSPLAGSWAGEGGRKMWSTGFLEAWKWIAQIDQIPGENSEI